MEGGMPAHRIGMAPIATRESAWGSRPTGALQKGR